MAEIIQESSLGTSVKRDKVAVNCYWLMAGEVSSKLLAFLITVYLTRTLGSAKFGLLSFASAFVMYGMLLTDFGLTKYGTREIARNPESLKEWVVRIQSTRLILSTFFFIIAALLSWLLLGSLEMKLLFLFSFFWLFPHAIGLDWVYRGFEKMGYSALWNFVQQAVYLALVLVLVTNKGHLVMVPVCRVAGCLAASVILLISLGKLTGFKAFVPVVDAKILKRVLAAGAPLAASYLMVQIYWNVDTIILGIVDKPEIVGIYNAAYKIILMAAVACYTVMNAYYPRLSYNYTHNHTNYRRDLARMMLIVIAAGIIATSVVFIFRERIILLFYGDDYRKAITALAFLAFVIFGDYLVSALATAFIAAGFEKLTFKTVVVGAVSNILFCIILIPRFSFVGAAIATIASYAIMIFLYLIRLGNVIGKSESAEA